MFLHLSLILFTGWSPSGGCISVHRESLSRGVSVQGDLCPGGLCPGGSLGCLCPGGLCPGGGSLSRKVSVQGVYAQEGVSICRASVQGGSLSKGGSLSERPPYGNMRAVRILLECILVLRCQWRHCIITEHASRRLHTRRYYCTLYEFIINR